MHCSVVLSACIALIYGFISLWVLGCRHCCRLILNLVTGVEEFHMVSQEAQYECSTETHDFTRIDSLDMSHQ